MYASGEKAARIIRGGGMSDDSNESHDSGTTRFPWAGPAFFGLVLVALAVFFMWFLKA